MEKINFSLNLIRKIKITTEAYLVALLLIISPLPFYRILFFSERVLLTRDIFRYYLAQKQLWTQSFLKDGVIPFWDYLYYSGFPHWANCNTGSFFPLNLILLFFSEQNFLKGYSFFVVMHYPVIALGAYFLLRTKRIRPVLACLCALSFTWTGMLISAHSNVGLSSMLAIPWFAACWILYLRSKQYWIWIFPASFFLMLPVLGGDPEYSYFLAFAAAGTIFWAQRTRLVLALLRILLLGGLAFMAGAIQILPTIDLAGQSDRGLSLLGIQEASYFSFHPIRLAELFLSNFFGNYLPTNTYWGGSYVNGFSQQPFFFSFYLGLVSLVATIFLVWELVCRRRKKSIFLTLAIIGSLLVAMGSFSPIPLYNFFFDFLPGWKAFRYPEKVMIWPVFLIWFYSAFAWRRILLLVRVARFYFFSYLIMAIGLIGIGYCFFVLQDAPFALGFKLLFLLGCLLLIYQKRFLSVRAFQALLLLLSSVDLFINAHSLIWDQPSSLVLEHSLARQIHMQENIISKEHPGVRRFFHATAKRSDLNSSQFAGLDDIGKVVLQEIELLSPNTFGLYGIPGVAGSATFEPRDYLMFWRAIQDQPKKFFDLTSVYYFPKRAPDGVLSLAANKSAFPYFFVPSKIQFVPDFFNALELVKSLEFSSSSEAVVETQMPWTVSEFGKKDLGEFKILKRTGTHLLLGLPVDFDAGFLVWNERYDSHWKAYVGDVRVPVLRVNAWSMGVLVSPNQLHGMREIDFRYENPFISAGISLSAIWLMLYVSFFTFFCYRKKVVNRVFFRD